MTDIQRHLKGIRKILYAALEESDLSDTLDINAMVAALRTYLPAGYGIGSGTLISSKGHSHSTQTILYDVPLTSEYLTSDPTEFAVETALLTLDFTTSHTIESLASALACVASIKQLQSFRGSSHKFPKRPIGQTRRVVPKYRLPYALLYFDQLEINPDDDIYTQLYRLMQPYPIELWPDEIDIIGQNIQFLNPLLDHHPANWYELGWSRTPNLQKPAMCYVCTQKYLRQHFYYDQLCMQCGDLNFSKRIQSVDLRGYRMLVTGARVKIGFAIVLRLLRAGAEVIVTTRFPRDAARRYSEVTDFADWADRLHIYGLDLRQVSRLEDFIAHLEATYPHLDAIINNAAQTVKRPPAFYAHLIPFETAPFSSLPSPLHQLLAGDQEDNSYVRPSIAGYIADAESDPDFPLGDYDEYGQQADNRDFNSWVMRLEEVSPTELAEVHLVNAIAPGILIGQLKRMLLRSPHPARFVINVSAAEGRFPSTKNGFHPHTNMAKAALNMLTRSIADNYAQDGIYVTSVDPGWVSDQVPRTSHLSRQSANNKLPIDMLDAASRVCDPIFTVVKKEKPVYGVLLKDYQVTAW